MNSYENFYREKLYPLQDGILRIIKQLGFPFYLTGGTALSRFYYNHRYSDDLDLFTNDNSSFGDYVNTFIQRIQRNEKFKIDPLKVTASADYIQLFVEAGDELLKIDFVNDIPVHYGDLMIHHEFADIDSWRNILSNKISGLMRLELKDFADIRVIAQHNKFNWRDIINEAKYKESSVDPVAVYELFGTFPINDINLIKWVNPPDRDIIKKDFSIIAEDILKGKDNSLIDIGP